VPSDYRRFVRNTAGLVGLVVVADALVAPPDPSTRFLVVVPGIGIALAVAYWSARRGGNGDDEAADA
jgi:orotidine-5'-phosphate decarboxylase